MHDACSCLTCQLLAVIARETAEVEDPHARVNRVLHAVAQVAAFTLAHAEDEAAGRLAAVIVSNRDEQRRQLQAAGGLQ
jgi:hypothetical protein